MEDDIGLHGIQGEHYSDHGTDSIGVECILEMWHGNDGSHQRSVISVGTSTAESHKDRIYLISHRAASRGWPAHSIDV
jgi:hypothetical protein